MPRVLVDVEVDRDTGPGAVRLGVTVTVFARRAAALVGVEHNHREPEWHFYFATFKVASDRPSESESGIGAVAY